MTAYTNKAKNGSVLTTDISLSSVAVTTKLMCWSKILISTCHLFVLVSINKREDNSVGFFLDTY